MTFRIVRCHLGSVVLLLGALIPAVFASPGHSGPLFPWGDNSANQITDAPAGNVSVIAYGGVYQGLAIRDDGTLALWGGAGDPFAVPPIPTDMQDESFVGAIIGRSHAVAIKPDGTVAGWGSNTFGQLNTPPGIRFQAVSAGNRHTIGLAADGTLYGWGANDVGQINVPAGRFTDTASRVLYSLALRDDGTLVGWGLSPSGIFAGWTPDGEGHRYLPNMKFKGIAAGNVHALGITVDKRVVGWGNDTNGELQAPVGVRFKQVTAGIAYSVGIAVNGSLHAWGDNSLGQLLVPPGRFEAVGAAAFHASAIARRAGD